MSISRLHVLLKTSSQTLHCSTIGVEHNKIELFYQYPLGSNTKARQGNIGEAHFEPAYFPDHISFHRDGTIHSTSRIHRKKKQYKNSLEVGTNVFDLKRNHFLPILVESLNLQSELTYVSRLKPCSERIMSEKTVVFDVSGLKSCSVILISKCERTNPIKMLSDHGFQNLKYVNFCIWSDVFPNHAKKKLDLNKSEFSTELVIAVVENIWEGTFKTLSSNSYSVEAQGVAQTICMPPLSEISKMTPL